MRSALAFTVVLLAALAAVPAQAAPAGRSWWAPPRTARSRGRLPPTLKMSLARLAGFNTIRMTSIWWPGNREVSGSELDGLRNAADRGRVERDPPDHHRVPERLGGDAATQPTARAQFAAYAASIPQLVPYVRDVVVGNEPNLNRFWMPQFTPTGSDAAASSYAGCSPRPTTG